MNAVKPFYECKMFVDCMNHLHMYTGCEDMVAAIPQTLENTQCSAPYGDKTKCATQV